MTAKSSGQARAGKTIMLPTERLPASLVAIDLAKNVFQVHGVDGSGAVLFQKKLSRDKLRDFLGRMESTGIAMEACATANYWARELSGCLIGRKPRIAQPVVDQVGVHRVAPRQPKNFSAHRRPRISHVANDVVKHVS